MQPQEPFLEELEDTAFNLTSEDEREDASVKVAMQLEEKTICATVTDQQLYTAVVHSQNCKKSTIYKLQQEILSSSSFATILKTGPSSTHNDGYKMSAELLHKYFTFIDNQGQILDQTYATIAPRVIGDCCDLLRSHSLLYSTPSCCTSNVNRRL